MRDYELTQDDEGKDVITQDGTYLGTVGAVDVGNDATVARSDGDSITDKVKDLLGWEDDDDNVIRNEDVEKSDEDRVHLRY